MLGYLRLHRNRGFTLIEIIISIFLISLVVIGVIIFFPTSKRATEESALKTRIANNVVSKVEELKGIGYRNLEELYNNYKDSDVLLLELDLERGTLKKGNGEIINQDSDLYRSFKIGEWQSSLLDLGISKGIIEIKKVVYANNLVDNLLDIKVRVEWSNGRNYEIRTYISR